MPLTGLPIAVEDQCVHTYYSPTWVDIFGSGLALPGLFAMRFFRSVPFCTSLDNAWPTIPLPVIRGLYKEKKRLRRCTVGNSDGMPL